MQNACSFFVRKVIFGFIYIKYKIFKKKYK